MRLVSVVQRCAVLALVALACGELYARFGSVDQGDAALLKPIVDATSETSRFGELPLGPTAAGETAWFADEPPSGASASGATTFPQLDARAADPTILSITGLNFPRVYNHADVMRSVCDDGRASFFFKLPHELWVFEPRAGELYPGFRFYPHARYPSGLRTNSFGYRSPEIVPSRDGDVVRVAFVGASTVLGHPRAPLTTADYVVHWLSRWARERDLGVKFDYVNAAREGIPTKQVTEILRREVAPLKPDIVFIWGFESFDFGSFVRMPDGVALPHPPGRGWIDAAAIATGTSAIADKSALLRLIGAWANRPFDRSGVAREPAKPAYERRLPPDFTSPVPHLGTGAPASLVRAHGELDDFIGAVRSLGALPILIANQYAAYDGALIQADRATLDPVLAAVTGGVYGYLNGFGRWPLTYADQRGILEYQTRLFHGLARERNVTFVDLLTGRTLDTGLFLDGPHLTPLGMKLTGWWMFQETALAIDAYLKTRQGRARTVSAEDLAYLKQEPTRIDVSTIDCAPLQAADEIAGAYPLSTISAAHAEAEVVKGDLPVIRTSKAPAAYAAAIPIDRKAAAGLAGKGWVGVRMRVREGHVSVGILDKTAQKFLAVFSLESGSDVQTVYLMVDDLSQIGTFMISNNRPGEMARSVAELHGVVLKRFR